MGRRVEQVAGVGEAASLSVGSDHDVPGCRVPERGSGRGGGGEEEGGGVEAAALGIEVEEGVADEEVGVGEAGLEGGGVEGLAGAKGRGGGLEGGDEGDLEGELAIGMEAAFENSR